MKSDNYYLRKIKGSLSYGRETYDTVKQIIVSNISSMGVECSTDDGMTTLASKILEIEPSIGGLDLDISSELESESATVTLGDNVVLNCTLNADYDSPDVDLKGKLQNASVNFYLGDTLLGTATTNISGVATYNYTTSDLGSLTFKSDFDGTENYDSCESNTVSVTVSKATPTLSISASSSSVNIGETSTISGVLADGSDKIGSATIKLYDSEDTLVDTLTTNANGEYSKTIQFDSEGSYSYYATFEGDSEYNSVTSNTVSVTVNDLGEPVEFVFNGTTLTKSPYATTPSFIGTNMIIDYGDETVEECEGNFGHTYSDGLTTHTIKVYRVTGINGDAFWDVTGMESINIANTVESLGNSAFRHCDNLEFISIPNSIKSIGHQCFYYCQSLESISIPNSVESLGNYVFDSCDALSEIVFNWEDNIVSFNRATYLTHNVMIDAQFSIPYGTMADYIEKGYPSEMLVERSE